jgi:hypothetical protein
MRTRVAAIAVASVVMTSCSLGNSPSDARDELAELAGLVDTATYAAVYRFAFTRQLAPGQATRMEITQQPPTTVRKLVESTRPEEGKPVDVTAWYIHNGQGDFACNEFPGVGVRCAKSPIERTTFGSAKLDVFFDAPRRPSTFAPNGVRKVARTVRIKGQRGTCFEAVPKPPERAPSSPEPPPERYRYELCYAEDGILLAGKRTSLDDSGVGGGAESFVELVSVSRVVEPSELRLPGDVTDPDDLPQ